MNSIILSDAKDTNGQNARYADASRRHGGHERVVKAMAIGNADPAGVVYRYQQAAERNDVGLSIRSAHRVVYEYMQFPTDLEWTRHTEREIKRLVFEADVIHLNNSWRPADHFRGITSRKPMLLHHHGSMLRNDPGIIATGRYRKMQQAVSTIDLMKPAPDLLPWLPTAYNVDELAAFARANARPKDSKLRIVHCPTNRALKHTELLIQAVAELNAERTKGTAQIDLVLVEGKTWQESLMAKAKADIVFDQLLYGYGCNGVEAWAMGKPVIAGADPWTLDRMAAMWPSIPFEEATEKTLKDVIRRLVHSKAAREDAGERGHAHVRRYHDELPALERLAELYADAMSIRMKPRIHGKGVMFHSPTRRSMVIDGQVVQFDKGYVTVTDVDVVRKLREFTVKRPKYGIAEAEELA